MPWKTGAIRLNTLQGYVDVTHNFQIILNGRVE